MLIEPNPVNFAQLLEARPHATRIEMAACPGTEDTTIEFVGDHGGTSGAAEAMKGADGDKKAWLSLHGTRTDTFTVACGNVGVYLRRAGLSHIDFWSLDVEGSELKVMQSFDWSIPVGVIVIEQNPIFGPAPIEQNRKFLKDKGFQHHSNVGVMNGTAVIARVYMRVCVDCHRLCKMRVTCRVCVSVCVCVCLH